MDQTETLDKIPETIADLINTQNVIGWFQGMIEKMFDYFDLETETPYM